MNIGDRFVTKLLDTKFQSENVYRGERVFTPNSRTIYGGELMAQALMAASKTVPKGFRPNSLHCYFHDRSSVLEPNDYYVTKLRDGRSFCHRLVEAFPINKNPTDLSAPYFRMDCSFKTPEKDPASFLSPMPNIPSVEKLQNFDSYLKSLDLDQLPSVPKTRVLQYQSFLANSPIETVFCEPEHIFGLKSNVGGRLHSWMRLKETPSTSLHSYRDAFLAYLSDALLLWVALTEPHHVSYLVTLNQSIWFHNPEIDLEPNEWVLCETRANYVGGALTLSYGDIWDEKGHLLASMAQQGLMRTQQMTPVSSYTSMGELAKQVDK
ncbi:hypothetical protein MN116_006066 [Schistosoma mekongi]|uniref:Acyl-coenzyme A thioesterase 8 n=1 Tax=Schistosoma mekongi TaxID=38744 RepID=A0AAE1ZB38_SCHME|nr:hypothetical protein MN116_006066 [Schistosoma mekongi]